MQPSTIQRLEGGRRTRGYVRTKPPLVSIIIVVRNGRNNIEKALESVFSQKKDIYELIVIDGASTDGTLDIIKMHNINIDYWISEADNGIYDAMNKAVKFTTGKYVYFLGCDDSLKIDLNKLVPILTDSNTIYYGNVHIATLTTPWNGPYNAWKLAWRTICQQAIFYPTIVFQTRNFCTDYKLAADYAFNLSCFGDKKLHFQYIPHVIADYSNTGASARVIDEIFEHDKKKYIRENLPVCVYVLFILTRPLVFLWRNQKILRPIRQLWIKHVFGISDQAPRNTGHTQI